jgi:hypothetical protein
MESWSPQLRLKVAPGRHWSGCSAMF